MLEQIIAEQSQLVKDSREKDAHIIDTTDTPQQITREIMEAAYDN